MTWLNCDPNRKSRETARYYASMRDAYADYVKECNSAEQDALIDAANSGSDFETALAAVCEARKRACTPIVSSMRGTPDGKLFDDLEAKHIADLKRRMQSARDSGRDVCGFMDACTRFYPKWEKVRE